MLLYLDTRRAPNPRKVRIYLAEKQLDIPIKELDLYAGEQKRPSSWPRIRSPGCRSWNSTTEQCWPRPCRSWNTSKSCIPTRP